MTTELVPELRTAQAAERPCQLYTHRCAPRPSRTQGHHRRPMKLQRRLYGRVIDHEILWADGLCHDSLHDVIDWLLGEARKPDPMPGRKIVTEAKWTVAWYLAALNERNQP